MLMRRRHHNLHLKLVDSFGNSLSKIVSVYALAEVPQELLVSTLQFQRLLTRPSFQLLEGPSWCLGSC